MSDDNFNDLSCTWLPLSPMRIYYAFHTIPCTNGSRRTSPLTSIRSCVLLTSTCVALTKFRQDYKHYPPITHQVPRCTGLRTISTPHLPVTKNECCLEVIFPFLHLLRVDKTKNLVFRQLYTPVRYEVVPSFQHLQQLPSSLECVPSR